MADARGGRVRDGLAVALVCSLALLVAGCGAVTTKSDRKRAAELAEGRYPGILEVLSARTLFPQTSGSEVTFSVADDPDAAVLLRIDAAAGTCDRGPCDRALDRTVEHGRSRAAELRRMRAAFTDCGYELVGATPALSTPWVAAAPTNATVTRVLAEIGACVRTWSPARDENGAPRRSVTVNIAAPDLARERPAGKQNRPTVLRMTDPGLLGALAKRPHYSVSYTLHDGVVDPASGRAYLSFPWEDRKAFETTVRAAVLDWLRTTRPRAGAGMVSGLWWLEAGTVDRLSGYVLFCDEPAEGARCAGDHAVVLTVDPKGNPVGDFRVIRDVRDDHVDGGGHRSPGPPRLPRPAVDRGPHR
ncbi:SCO7460 family lipoprotein [Streptomyces scopuliridis]|uniref:SCO7460 family lipoprotein n=1 Tax=Streptomyces scopuliridis TaxID=452529 RepID=UPI00368B0C1A